MCGLLAAAGQGRDKLESEADEGINRCVHGGARSGGTYFWAGQRHVGGKQVWCGVP